MRRGPAHVLASILDVLSVLTISDWLREKFLAEHTVPVSLIFDSSAAARGLLARRRVGLRPRDPAKTALSQ